MGETGGLSTVRRLLGAEVRPGRVLRWFTTRRIMVLVAVAAVGLAADAMRRRRDECLALALRHRTLEQRAREDFKAFQDKTRDWLRNARDRLEQWRGQAEARGSAADAARCLALIEAIDRLGRASHDGWYQEPDLAEFDGEVARLTADAIGDWTPGMYVALREEFRPDSFAIANSMLGGKAKSFRYCARQIEHHARMASKHERGASHPWESVEPDPPAPGWSD